MVNTPSATGVVTIMRVISVRELSARGVARLDMRLRIVVGSYRTTTTRTITRTPLRKVVSSAARWGISRKIAHNLRKAGTTMEMVVEVATVMEMAPTITTTTTTTTTVIEAGRL